MLDVVVIAMFFVLLALGFSVYSVKYSAEIRAPQADPGHAWRSTLLVVLVLFEIDVHFIDKWMVRADASPYFDAATKSGLGRLCAWQSISSSRQPHLSSG